MIYSAPMMRIFRLFLIWLLMAVVPLQAVAAIVGMCCASGPRQAMQHPCAMQTAEMSVDSARQYEPAEFAALARALPPVPGVELPNPASNDASAEPATCSSCSAFCVGAVMPVSLYPQIASYIGAETLTISVDPMEAGFIPDGLRRPPRHNAA